MNESHHTNPSTATTTTMILTGTPMIDTSPMRTLPPVQAMPYVPEEDVDEVSQTLHLHRGPEGETTTAVDFSDGLLTATSLASLQLEERLPLLGRWLREGDLGYLFAPRGAGKSWLAILIGNAVSKGLPLGVWCAGEAARPVFYFDAEMNLPDVQQRARKVGIDSEDFHWLSNELIFLKHGHGVNIASPTHQKGLSILLPDKCLFVIDNLSTSQLGMAENDNDSFDAIRDWLLTLRHRSITVMIVHHAGRNGAMRGSSRREDMAHWIISVKAEALEPGCAKNISTTFAKIRNCQEKDVPPLKWNFKDDGERITFTCFEHHADDAMLGHIRDGVTRATELAELLGVQVGTVSKWAKKLMISGKLTKNGREYALVDWPETIDPPEPEEERE